MAMKFTVTFLLLISIGEIYSKTLLEKIRDDSDLSQVSNFCGASPLGVTSKKGLFVPRLSLGVREKKEEAKKLEKFLASARKALHNRKKKRVLCNMSGTVFSGSDHHSGRRLLSSAVSIAQLIGKKDGDNFN